MPNGVVNQIKQSSSGWFQGLFVLAAVICATASFIALARTSPIAKVPQEVLVLLVLNTVVLLILGWIVVTRYLSLQSTKTGDGGGRLARRFMLLFGLSSMIPAVVVSLFLWATIENGIETWFGQRVGTLVDESRALADTYISDFSDRFEQDARLVAVDINNAGMEVYQNEREQLAAYLGIQSYLRYMSAAYIVDQDGLPTVTAENMVEPGYYRRASPETIGDAESGEVVLSLQEQAGFAFALLKLDAIDGQYLYLAQSLDTNLISQLRRAQSAFDDYALAEERSDELQRLFVIAYFQIVALVLLLSIRLAQEAAGRISGPISRLAHAAHDVREGVRGVQVPLPPDDDEVRALSQSFNVMTSQLDDRRAELIAAREEAEMRQVFLETLLADLSAGVVRLDQAGVITIANRSAESLLGMSDIAGKALSDIAPELTQVARQTIDTGKAIDASLNLEGEAGTRHIRLKVTQDNDDGYVLTFDDASKLVNAQRQLAWRDVARRIAHEIRNPLTPILLSTERLKRRYSGKIDDPEGVFERCIDTIMRQVNDIGRMVKEFSDFARMPNPTPSIFKLPVLIEDICFSQRVVSPDLDIQFNNHAVGIEVFGDERLLAQAFGNIVKNAAEALSSRPEDDETVGQISIALQRLKDGHVEITFCDNGPGFPPDAKEQLLEPYVTAKEGGTGLGLAIVNRVIMDHGGTINLQHRPDGLPGAFVRVVLPVELAETKTKSPERLESVV